MSTKNKNSVIHGPSHAPEYTLCGLAFDAYDSGDEDVPVNVAREGVIVTCKDCRAALDDMRRSYRRYKLL